MSAAAGRTVFRFARDDLVWEGFEGERPRRLAAADSQRFDEWATRYRRLLGRPSAAAELLTLGREMADWLDAGGRWLERARETAGPPPWIVEFAVPVRPGDVERAFLDAPWELLADERSHLAAQEDLLFCPVRRFGQAAEPEKPSPLRLGVVFMAASLEGLTVLSYEDEETAILDSVGTLGLDLVVEESGTLPLLRDLLADAAADDGGRPDVLHLSCHGRTGSPPVLLLENDEGGPAPAPAAELARDLGPHLPRLLFLSACETGTPAANSADGELVGSLAAAMVLVGTPAVLGWGGSVGDREATRFAKELYGGLARHGAVEETAARARLELLRPREGKARPSEDWHLARLYLGSRGGGVLARGRRPRGRRGREAVHKAFLDARKQQVPVASPREFVGRRRQIQEVLRELRRDDFGRPAGVLIHGLGRQGKSSLAARVAQRFGDHALAVVFGRYDAPAVMAAVADALGSADEGWVETWREPVTAEPRQLEPALRELLEGPCRVAEPAAQGRPARRPLLLVIDDFEQALELQAEGPSRLRPELVEPVRAVLLAFGRVETASRLLVTSRQRFTLPDGDRDLAQELHDLALPSMKGFESRKQARAKERTLESGALLDEQRTERIVEVAGGHPGLQDLLFTLGVEDPEACDGALSEMEAYRQGEAEPSQAKLVAFLEKLALDTLLGLLRPNELELLRASALFEIPVPHAVIARLARWAGLASGDGEVGRRLVDLGLWEVYVVVGERSLLLSGLVSPRLRPLTVQEQAGLARLVVGPLFALWEGALTERLSGPTHELARLALLAEDAAILAATAANAVLSLTERYLFRNAAEFGRRAVAKLKSLGTAPPLKLLRNVGELCLRTGDIEGARELLDRVIAACRELAREDEEVDAEVYATALLSQADLFRSAGDLESALASLEEARGCLVGEHFVRTRAITLAKIAGIHTLRWELDQALRIYEEELLPVFEKLGDKHSSTCVVVEMAHIYLLRGELNRSFRLLQHEALPVFDRLGDVRQRAFTLRHIAEIHFKKWQLDEALRLLQEEVLPVFEKLGEVRERAFTLVAIAKIHYRRKKFKKALWIVQEEVLSVCDKFGDKRERAIALSFVADIYKAQGELDEALRIIKEETLPAYEELGEARAHAHALQTVADIYETQGRLDDALRVLQEEALPAYEKFDDKDAMARALWSIGGIEARRRDFHAAVARMNESYVINLRLGRLDGVAVVGLDLGQLLCDSGEVEEGKSILLRSRAGFEKLGWADNVRRIDEILAQLPNDGNDG